MVLRQLEYLVALAREKHFGRAADACHVSQPTLSAAIRLLEDDLGAPIVERGHRYVGLTPQGQVALEHAHRILAEVENLRRGLEEIDKGLTGHSIPFKLIADMVNNIRSSKGIEKRC